MSTADELYAAILANPDDMGLRARYADAIAVSDPRHAELIRLQLMDRRDVGPDAYRPGGHYARIAALEVELWQRLVAPIEGLVSAVQVRRGFPELIRLPGRDFLDRGADLYRLAPVRHVLLTDLDLDLSGRVLASPLLDRLVSLDLGRNRLGDALVGQVLASPHVRQLRWLGLGGCGISRAGLEEFAAGAGRALPNLRVFNSGGNAEEVSPRGVGQDAISGAGPLDVEVPWFGRHLDATYGPFRWLDPELGWHRPDFDEV